MYMLPQSVCIHTKEKKKVHVLRGRGGQTNLGGAEGGDIVA